MPLGSDDDFAGLRAKQAGAREANRKEWDCLEIRVRGCGLLKYKLGFVGLVYTYIEGVFLHFGTTLKGLV